MKMPVLLLGSALLFWGWQTDLWLVAIPLALILEGHSWIPWRWDLSEVDFRRIFNLCGILFFILLIYLWVTNQSLSVIFDLIKGLPCNFFPLVVSQTYSANPTINLRTLFSKKSDLNTHSTRDNVDLQRPYFALCLLSASAANTEGNGFYVGMVALIAGLLWSLRPKRTSPVLWLCLIMLIVNAGFIGQIGLHQLHVNLEQQAVPWLNGFEGQSVNPYQSATQIGSIGDLKQSNTIVFRVATGDRPSLPLLLREATYNKYQGSAWVAMQSQFQSIQPTVEGTTWIFREDSEKHSSLTVSAQLDRGQGLLRLPDGTSSLHQLLLSKMTKNQYGAVKVEGKSNAITYQVQFHPTQSSPSLDSPPTEADLEIPDLERPVITQTLQQLTLEKKSPAQTLKKIAFFFEQNFQYSLSLSSKSHSKSPLSAFLLNTHSGHCEFFASATTLLLRAAGIPARYATGYAVHEFSPLENQYIVRGRDAHAWTMAYIDGSWQSFDTTPPNWNTQINPTDSPLTWIIDLWSYLSFKLSTTLQSFTKDSILPWVGWTILPLGLFFLWYIRQKKRKLQTQRQLKLAIAPKTISTIIPSGLDSEFYSIEQELAKTGLNRCPSESLKQWIHRLEKHLQPNQVETLREIIKLHYRYRFDPSAIKSTERIQLRSLSQTWLKNYHS